MKPASEIQSEAKRGAKKANGIGRAKKGATAPPEPEVDAELQPTDLEWQKNFFAEQRLGQAKIPRRFWNKTLLNFRKTGAMRKNLAEDAMRFAKVFNLNGELHPGLLMRGDVGCGKTHLAVGILREVVAKGYSGLYYNSPDLLREIRATYDDSTVMTEDVLLDEISNVDLLVLDDLGAEKISGFVLDRFYLIVNKRYEGCKPMIVTTNLDQETLINRLGDRLVSRLIEMCSDSMHFPSDDYRRLKMEGKG